MAATHKGKERAMEAKYDAIARPTLKRLALAALVAGALVTGASIADHPAHAAPSRIHSNYTSRYFCYVTAGNESVSVSANWGRTWVSGSCFLGNPSYVILYDARTSTYINGGWNSVATADDGSFSGSWGGGACGDTIYALGYDPGWGTYTSWAATTMQCPPR